PDDKIAPPSAGDGSGVELKAPRAAEWCGDRFFLEPVRSPLRPRHPWYACNFNKTSWLLLRLEEDIRTEPENAASGRSAPARLSLLRPGLRPATGGPRVLGLLPHDTAI